MKTKDKMKILFMISPPLLMYFNYTTVIKKNLYVLWMNVYVINGDFPLVSF